MTEELNEMEEKYNIQKEKRNVLIKINDHNIKLFDEVFDWFLIIIIIIIIILNKDQLHERRIKESNSRRK
jgi:hypothetical protein